MKVSKKFKHWLHPQRSNNHRPAILKPTALLVIAAFVVLTAAFSQKITTYIHTPFGVVLGITSDITQDEIVAFTNQQRTRQGLSELTTNQQLTQAAHAKAKDMFDKQYWAHVSPQGKQPWAFISEADYSYQVAGENLARDFQHSNEVVSAWMDSPTHRANVLHQRYTQIGVAVVEGNLEGIETTLVVQMFGTPATNARTQTEPATVSVIQTGAIPADATITEEPESAVLAGQSLQTSVLQTPIIISPIGIMKSLFLGILLIIMTTLVYDFVIVSHARVVRVVGKNMAHVFLFLTVAYLLLYYKGGFIL